MQEDNIVLSDFELVYVSENLELICNFTKNYKN